MKNHDADFFKDLWKRMEETAVELTEEEIEERDREDFIAGISEDYEVAQRRLQDREDNRFPMSRTIYAIKVVDNTDE